MLFGTTREKGKMWIMSARVVSPPPPRLVLWWAHEKHTLTVDAPRALQVQIRGTCHFSGSCE